MIIATFFAIVATFFLKGSLIVSIVLIYMHNMVIVTITEVLTKMRSFRRFQRFAVILAAMPDELVSVESRARAIAALKDFYRADIGQAGLGPDLQVL